MKGLLAGITTMALVVSVGSTAPFTAGNGWGRNFTDADNDGICDNYGANGCGMGAGYIDADGDGVCDNITAGTSKNGTGFQRGCPGGQGRCFGGQNRRGR